MILDGVRCTHNGTGGSGTLTLAAVTGFPQPTSAYGSSGTRLIRYVIAEYTDSTFATLSKLEWGIGSLVLSTNVLTRTTVLGSWTSGGSYNNGNPTALSFGNTAANIQILVGAGGSTQKLGTPGLWNFGGDIWRPFNTRITYDSNVGAYTLTANQMLWIPVEFIHGGPISQVAVSVAVLHAASALRVGLYEWDPVNGGPLNLINEFTSASQIAPTSTGWRSVTMGTPIWVPPGFYWIGLLGNDSTVQLDRLTHSGEGLFSSSSQRDILMFDKGVTYGALPALGSTSYANVFGRSAGGQVGVFFK